MRVVLILFVQLVISAFVTVSVMPLVLVSVPAAQDEPKLGLGLMFGVCGFCFALLALLWPRRRS